MPLINVGTKDFSFSSKLEPEPDLQTGSDQNVRKTVGGQVSSSDPYNVGECVGRGLYLALKSVPTLWEITCSPLNRIEPAGGEHIYNIHPSPPGQKGGGGEGVHKLISLFLSEFLQMYIVISFKLLPNALFSFNS